MNNAAIDDAKLCRTCGETKPKHDFHKRKALKSGFSPKCKSCVSEYSKKRHAANSGTINERTRAYYAANKKAILATKAARRAKKPDEIKAKRAEWYAKNTKKWKSHNAVKSAVDSGDLIKPVECEHCYSKERLDGHHPDYDKPLQVMWLCRGCHMKEHVRLKDATP